MPGRKKIFDFQSRRERYVSSGVNEKLIFNLRDIHCTMRQLYEGKGSMNRVLIVLSKTGPITQMALTERLEIQPASVSDVLAKMEALGLAVRRPSQQDQRTADVLLTPEGEARAQEASAQRLQRHQEMFSCLSDDEKAAFLSTLEKINADWEERYRQSAEP
ncbi:MAG: MarR family transcriptional regulator [Clostridia bacterium]|nr:MarR family transcriptional regulator [Clostridia bacterium]